MPVPSMEGYGLKTITDITQMTMLTTAKPASSNNTFGRTLFGSGPKNILYVKDDSDINFKATFPMAPDAGFSSFILVLYLYPRGKERGRKVSAKYTMCIFVSTLYTYSYQSVTAEIKGPLHQLSASLRLHSKKMQIRSVDSMLNKENCCYTLFISIVSFLSTILL